MRYFSPFIGALLLVTCSLPALAFGTHGESDELLIEEDEGPAPAPSYPNSAMFKGDFQSLLAVDTAFEGAREDVVEWRNRLNLRLSMDVTPHFRVIASGRFSHWIGFEGAREEGDFRADTLRNVFESELRDTFATWSLGAGLDLRVGLQTFTWGRTDFSQPLDVLNPLDLRAGVADQSTTPKSPIFAIEAVQAWGPVNASLVWIPFFKGHSYELFGSDWALMRPELPFLQGGTMAEYMGLMDVVHPTRYEEIQGLFSATEDPPQNGITGSDVALRLTTNLGGVDLGLAATYQWDRLPFIRNIDFAQLNMAIAGYGTGNKAANIEAIRQGLDIGYERRWVAGGDVEWVLGDFAIKGDVAFSDARTQYVLLAVPGSADEVSVGSIRKPNVGWAVQVDAMPGHGLFFSLEASGNHILDLEPGTQLLMNEAEVFRVSGLAQWRFGEGDAFQVQVTGMASVTQKDAVIMPQFKWRASDGLSLAAGATIFLRDPDILSPIALFDANDFAYVRSQLSF